MKTGSILSVTLLVSAAGCFSPEVGVDSETATADADATGSSSATDNGSMSGPTPSGTGSSSSPGETETVADASSTAETAETAETIDPTTSETDAGAAPIVSLLINGSEDPDAVASASGIEIEIGVEDPDGEVAGVELLVDGQPLDITLSEVSGGYRGEWIVSGAEVNGARVLEAVAVDDDGLEGSASGEVTLELPDGGLIEGWVYDNGEGGSALGIAPSPEGDEVVWSGQVFVGGNQLMRVDRIVGDPWQGNGSTNDDQGGDVLRLNSGSHVVASAAGDAFDLDTRLRRYSPSGVAQGMGVFDGSDNNASSWPLGLEADDAGDYYVLGAFTGAGAYSSFLLKANSDYTQEWKRNLTASAETDGAPLVYDFDVRPDGQIAVVGSHAEIEYLWLATYTPGGELEEQLSLPSEFDASIGFDVSWDPDGGLVVAGSADEGTGWGRFVRKYDSALLEEWTVDGPGNDDFGLAVTVDDHGHTVVAFTENCNFTNPFGYNDCRLVLRSYDGSGAMRWQHVAEDSGSEFTGPLFYRPGAKPDVEVDRYGYIYVTALHDRPLGGGETRPQWWAEKHHP